MVGEVALGADVCKGDAAVAPNEGTDVPVLVVLVENVVGIFPVWYEAVSIAADGCAHCVLLWLCSFRLFCHC